MVIKEKAMLKMLADAQKILLVEPPYPRKYPPFALAKIKTYLEQNFKGKEIVYAKEIPPEKFDLICVTTLFTYYSSHVFSVINNRGFFNLDTSILLGGVLASLMPEQFEKENMYVFKGYSKTIDLCAPNREIMEDTDDKWKDVSWVFTSRGCPNKCSFCTVWRIEKDKWVNPKWKRQIMMDRPIISIMDNNLSSIEIDHMEDIVDFSLKHKKKVIIESGFDCKFVTPELAKLAGKLKYARHGMRTAFDRIEEDGLFQKAVNMLQDNGVKAEDMFAYVLFNFTDRPKEANYRAEECFKLGVRAYPQCYRPLNHLSKDQIFVGKHWTFRLTKAYRHYWIMKGVRGGFRDMSFDEWIHSEKGRRETKLTDRDVFVWDSNGV